MQTKLTKRVKQSPPFWLSLFRTKQLVNISFPTSNIARYAGFVKVLLKIFNVLGGDIINASDKAFVIKVRKRMIDLGINQRILAEKIGISPAYISQIFTGERDLTIDIQRRIIDVLWQKEPNEEIGKRRNNDKYT